MGDRTNTDFVLDGYEPGLFLPSPPHVLSRGRCIHCGCDDHSLPNPGEEFSAWELPCPVDGEDRKSSWSFGPDSEALSEEELEALPSHAMG